MKNLLIIGAGQYGAMLKESARVLNRYDKIDFLDDNSEIAIGKIADYAKFTDTYQCAIVAIGNADIRLDTTAKLKAAGYEIVTFVSPRAHVSPSVVIGEGSVIEPMSVINTGTVIGTCCIISGGGVINHNATIGDGCHINCNATVRSNSIVPDKTKVDYGEIF